MYACGGVCETILRTTAVHFAVSPLNLHEIVVALSSFEQKHSRRGPINFFTKKSAF